VYEALPVVSYECMRPYLIVCSCRYDASVAGYHLVTGARVVEESVSERARFTRNACNRPANLKLLVYEALSY
jgi:hypothetical protein